VLAELLYQVWDKAFFQPTVEGKFIGSGIHAAFHLIPGAGREGQNRQNNE
jgi:hypothetical protein